MKEGVKLMEPPSAAAVDQVDMVLRDVGQKVRRRLCVLSILCFASQRAIATDSAVVRMSYHSSVCMSL